MLPQKEEMPENQNTLIPEDKITEKSIDPRLDIFTDQYYAMFYKDIAKIPPEQLAEQLPRLTKQWANEFALDRMEAEDAGDRDQLTNLLNRGGFYKAFDLKIQQYHRNVREGHKIEDIHTAFLYFDLDGFKGVNETYSHEAGDQILSVTGQLLKTTLRPTDIIARLGGDEFGACLDNVTFEQAIIIANRIQLNLAQSFSELFPELEWPKTISIGVCQLSDLSINQLKSDDHSDLAKRNFHKADVAQFKGAKHAGKNKIGVMLDNGQIKTAIVTYSEDSIPIITYQTPQSSPS